MKENILITGGAGYLGSILTEELLKHKYNVTVVDNFCYGQTSLNHLVIYDNLFVINADVRNVEIMKKIISKSDIIIPLAALVGAPICEKDPVGAETINKIAVFDMLKIIGKDQVVIMPTTNSAYGTGDKNNYCDESSTLTPISKYAKDKVIVEEKLLEHRNSISLRLATVFGMSPRMRLDLLVNDFVYKAVYEKVITLFEGHFKRNYIHVRDVSKAFIHSINNFQQMKNEIYNVGLSTANLSKIELCQKIKLVIKDLNIIELNNSKDIDQRNYIVSNDKIEKTGFKPNWDLNRGIKELVRGYPMLSNKSFSNI